MVIIRTTSAHFLKSFVSGIEVYKKRNYLQKKTGWSDNNKGRNAQ